MSKHVQKVKTSAKHQNMYKASKHEQNVKTCIKCQNMHKISKHVQNVKTCTVCEKVHECLLRICLQGYAWIFKDVSEETSKSKNSSWESPCQK